MKKKLSSYFKWRYCFYIIYVMIIGIFGVVLYLYNVNTEAIQYASVLSAFLLISVGVMDYISYSRHIGKVEAVINRLPYELPEMPQGREQAEVLYGERIQQLFSYKEELENDTRIGRQEMFDYYSLWVHQIKTPISAMHLLLQSFEEDDGQESNAQFLHPMKMELFKTEQYVEMVLSYLRIDAMSSDLSLQWVEIDNIIRQAVRKYSQLFILKKIQLVYQKCEGKVLTDEKWLLLVLEQLLSNALKYTAHGKISIYMEAGKEMVLVIEDSGIGIQAEDLPRIFEKGFTGYNGRKDKKSTGIGLYLCKSVCDKLKHGIEVESEEGKGTKVRVYLYRETL